MASNEHWGSRQTLSDGVTLVVPSHSISRSTRFEGGRSTPPGLRPGRRASRSLVRGCGYCVVVVLPGSLQRGFYECLSVTS